MDTNGVESDRNATAISRVNEFCQKASGSGVNIRTTVKEKVLRDMRKRMLPQQKGGMRQ